MSSLRFHYCVAGAPLDRAVGVLVRI